MIEKLLGILFIIITIWAMKKNTVEGLQPEKLKIRWYYLIAVISGILGLGLLLDLLNFSA